MSNDLTQALEHLITSPPGQLVAGSALAGIVWKCFERVEGVLSEETKFEIAVWVVGLNAEKNLATWPTTFASMFDRVFGKRHLSWICFCRSTVASFSVAVITWLVLAILSKPSTLIRGSLALLAEHPFRGLIVFAAAVLCGNVIPDYLSLLETRLALTLLRRSNVKRKWRTACVLFAVVDLIATTLIALVGLFFAASIFYKGILWAFTGGGVSALVHIFTAQTYNEYMPLHRVIARKFTQLSLFEVSVWIVPAYFTSLWLWLYIAAGSLLTLARRFDIGLDFFIHKVDIEKKPLAAIGLVSGALVAVIYWFAALLLYIVKR